MKTLIVHIHMMMIILCYSLLTVVCWLGQTISPVDFCPTLPSLDWGRGGLLTSHGGPTRLAMKWVCGGFLNKDESVPGVPCSVGRRASPCDESLLA